MAGFLFAAAGSTDSIRKLCRRCLDGRIRLKQLGPLHHLLLSKRRLITGTCGARNRPGFIKRQRGRCLTNRQAVTMDISEILSLCPILETSTPPLVQFMPGRQGQRTGAFFSFSYVLPNRLQFSPQSFQESFADSVAELHQRTDAGC